MKVGFLEYQLTNSHFKKFHQLLTGAVGAGQVQITMAHELEPTQAGKDWCAANNVKYAETAQEVVEQNDALLVLAPNNPEKHLEVAGPALGSGKPVYIDKFLADKPATAISIVETAQKMKTPLMCASALRFALEAEELDKQLKGEPTGIFARGYGKFPIYAVHTIALAMRYFGGGLKRVIDTGGDAVHFITVQSDKGKATLEVRDSKSGAKAHPWQVGFIDGDGNYQIATITNNDGFYENLMRNALEFFKTGKSPVSVEEQIAAVQVQYYADQSVANGNQWVDVKEQAKAVA